LDRAKKICFHVIAKLEFAGLPVNAANCGMCIAGSRDQMKVFVAGATGVIGRRIVPLLVQSGAQVTGVARSPAKARQLEGQGAIGVRVDLFDPAAVEAAVAGHDIVINMATRIPSGVRAMVPGAFNENARLRTEASQNLAAAAIAARSRVFIQESFAPTYPDRGDEWIDENVPIEPSSYVRSVTNAESAAEEFTKSGGTGVVLRFSMFYGPDSSTTIDIINTVRHGLVPAFGAADSYVSSVWTDDAAAAVFAAMSVPAGTYNVTDDVPVRRGEAFSLLADELGVKRPRMMPSWVTRAAGSIGETLGRSQRISNAKFRHATTWVPHVPSLREGWKVLLREIAEKAGETLRA
jgi:nucleoside-diphosphate-sugar epimerase